MDSRSKSPPVRALHVGILTAMATLGVAVALSVFAGSRDSTRSDVAHGSDHQVLPARGAATVGDSAAAPQPAESGQAELPGEAMGVTSAAQPRDPRAERAFERQARREIQHLSTSVERFERVAEDHDFSERDRAAVLALLADEHRAAMRFVATFGDTGLEQAHAAVEDLREDTDTAAAALLSGDAWRAYRVMRRAPPLELAER